TYQKETDAKYLLQDLKEELLTQEEVFETQIVMQQKEEEIIHKTDSVVIPEVDEIREESSEHKDTISLGSVEKIEEEVIDKQKVLNIVDVSNLLLEFEKKDVEILVEGDKVEESFPAKDISLVGYDKIEKISDINFEIQGMEDLWNYKDKSQEIINVTDLFSEISKDSDIGELKVDQMQEKKVSGEMVFEQEKQSLSSGFQDGELSLESSLNLEISEDFQLQPVNTVHENLSDILNIDNLLSEFDNDEQRNLELQKEETIGDSVQNELGEEYGIQKIENFELKEHEVQEMLGEQAEEQKLSSQNIDLHSEVKEEKIEFEISLSSEQGDLNDILADVVNKENLLFDQSLVNGNGSTVIEGEEAKQLVDNWDVSVTDVERSYEEEKIIYDVEKVEKDLDDTFAKIEESIIKVEGIDELAAILEEHQKEMVTPSLGIDIDLSNLSDMEIDLSNIDLSDINVEFSEPIDIGDIGEVDGGASVFVEEINQQEQQDIEKKTDTDNRNGFVYSQDIQFKVQEIQKGFLIQDVQKIIILKDMEYAYYSADNKINEEELMMLKDLGGVEFTSLYFEKGKIFGFILNEAKTLLLIVFSEGVQVGPVKLKIKAIKLGG
ncbi:MAG: hypothetical protein N2169_05105, partial [bacterium]|nr:hypothetical protein [bacterium]